MDVIECLAILQEENMAMVKRLLRPVDKGGSSGDLIVLPSIGVWNAQAEAKPQQ